jgi:hypothetical protein
VLAVPVDPHDVGGDAPLGPHRRDVPEPIRRHEIDEIDRDALVVGLIVHPRTVAVAARSAPHVVAATFSSRPLRGSRPTELVDRKATDPCPRGVTEVSRVGSRNRERHAHSLYVDDNTKDLIGRRLDQLECHFGVREVCEEGGPFAA